MWSGFGSSCSSSARSLRSRDLPAPRGGRMSEASPPASSSRRCSPNFPFLDAARRTAEYRRAPKSPKPFIFLLIPVIHLVFLKLGTAFAVGRAEPPPDQPLGQAETGRARG